MRKIIGLAVLAVALLAMPAQASVQNIKLSGDVQVNWLVRDQYDLGSQTITDRFYQNALATHTRLRVDADLTDNVSATVALINERAWGDGDVESTNGANDMDINLAYITLREMLYSPLTVVLGRQNFAYGNSFVIDSGGTNNSVSSGGLLGVAGDLTKRTAADAVRLIFDYSPITVDIVAMKNSAGTVAGTGLHDDDIDIFGSNVNWDIGDDLGTVVETYFWAKIDQSVKSTLGSKADTVYMPGFRAEANLLDGLNVSAEAALQFGTEVASGSNSNAERKAQAAQIMANYALPLEETKEYSPVLMTAFTVVSGDSNPSDLTDQYEAWDPMLENQATGRLYNAMFNLSNLQIVTIRGSIVPLEDVTAAFEWNGLWLDKALADTDNDGNTSVSVIRPDSTTPLSLSGTTDSKLGDDLAFELIYDYTEDVQIGASYSWFFPGAAFSDANDQTASQILVNAIVNF